MKRALTSLFLATAFSLAASPAPAHAEPARQPASVVVDYSDLNTSKPAGARVLLSRMKRAAYKACDGSPGFAHLAHQMHRRACERDALAHAAASVDEPMVSELIHRNDRAWQFAAR